MLLYFVFVLGIGFALKRYMKTSKDFFQAGRALPAWICGLAFISANLGAQEVIGMGASGAKYGLETAHFYGIGAIPAMIFVGIFMMPFYYGSKARSRARVSAHALRREDPRAQRLLLRRDDRLQLRHLHVRHGAAHPGAARLRRSLPRARLAAGGHLHLLHRALGAVIVLLYIFLGGLTSAIYNEVLQFFLIIAGFLPLVLLGLKNIGGWSGLKATLPVAYMHEWKGVMHASTNPMGIEIIGIGMGLGFVLGSGYWCTDFLVIQTAMASKNMESARRVPLIAAVPKMFFPFLVILPGLLAIGLPTPHTTTVVQPRSGRRHHPRDHVVSAAGRAGHGTRPRQDQSRHRQAHAHASGQPLLDYDMATPNMLLHFFPTGILGLGLTALLASFMSGMAGNVTAFNTVFTYDLYQSYIHKGASDRHYLAVGRWATVGGILLSIATAYAAINFNNIMDTLQLVFSFVNAPLFATFLLGMFWKRATGHGAFAGLIAGTAAAMLHHGLTLPDRGARRHPWRMDRRRAPLSQRHGAELLGRHLRLQHQLHRGRGGQPAHQAAPRVRVGGPGPLAHAQAVAPRVIVVEASRGTGRGHSAGRRCVEYFLCLRKGLIMNLDLRIPMGGMFTLVGLILTVFGLRTNGNAALYAKSLGINANLWWGIVLLVFGLTMFLLGRRGQKLWLRKNFRPHPRKAKLAAGTERGEQGTGFSGQSFSRC